MKLSTHRVLQLSALADSSLSKARICSKGAANLRRINNHKGASYQSARAMRFERIAFSAQRLLEART